MVDEITEEWGTYRRIQEAFFTLGYLKLPLRELRVYFALHRFIYDEVICHPNRDTLVELTDLSLTSISGALTDLQTRGLIAKKQRRGEKREIWLSNEYSIEKIAVAFPGKRDPKPKTVTKKLGHGESRDERGHFRGAVSKKLGRAVTKKLGRAVTNALGHKRESLELEYIELEKTTSPLDGKKFKGSKQKPKDQKPKPSPLRGRGFRKPKEPKTQEEPKPSIKKGRDYSSIKDEALRKEIFSSLVSMIPEFLKSMGVEQLKNYLLHHGWDDPQVIEQAFAEAKKISPETQAKSSSSIEGKPKKRRGRGKREGGIA